MRKRLLLLSDKLKRLKELKNEWDCKVKELNVSIEKVQGEMVELMVNDELQSFSREGTTFSLVINEYYAPETENKDELWDVMKKQGFGHLFSINARTLQSTLKEIVEENEQEIPKWLNGLIKKAEKSSIRIAKSK